MITPFKHDLTDSDADASEVDMGRAPATKIKAPGGVQRAIAAGGFALVFALIVTAIVDFQTNDSSVTLATFIVGAGAALAIAISELNRESRAHAKAIDREAYSKQAAVESHQRMAEQTHGARLDAWKEMESAKAEAERAKARPLQVKADAMERAFNMVFDRLEALPKDDPNSIKLIASFAGLDRQGDLPLALPSGSVERDEDGLIRPDIKITGGLSGAMWPLADGRKASVDLIERMVRFTYNYDGEARVRLKEKNVSFGNGDFAIANDALVELGIKARVGDSGKTRWVVPYDVARQAVPYLKVGQRPPIPLPQEDFRE